MRLGADDALARTQRHTEAGKETVPRHGRAGGNTGVCLENVEEQLCIADGCVTATTFKRRRLRQLCRRGARGEVYGESTPYPTIKWG